MTGIYRKALPYGTRIELDTDVVSNVLIGAGTGPLNALAKEAAETAKSRVRPSGKRFIGFKAAKPFKIESTDIGKPVSLLVSRLRLPVALVFNNSLYAVQQEVGSLDRDLRAERPLSTVLSQYGRKRGVRSIREKRLGEAVTFGTRSRASRRKKKGGRK